MAGSTTAIAPNLYLNEGDLEAHYNIPPRTAQRWRSSGEGPPFVRVGPRRVMYRVADVENWLANRTFNSRADELARKITPPSSRKHTGRRLAETNEASLEGYATGTRLKKRYHRPPKKISGGGVSSARP